MTKKKTVKTPKQRVHVKFLQDNSGSMERQWNDCKGGFASFVKDLQAKEDVDYIFSLTLFNSTAVTALQAVPLASVNPNHLDRIRAGGGTALYDALGASMLADDGQVDKTIYIIVTDGQENESRTWNKDSIHSMIDAKLKADKSTFQYLGAQPESWDDARAMGLGAGQTIHYDQSNYIGTYRCVADSVNNFSASDLNSSRSMTASFGSANLIKAANMVVKKDDDDPLVTVT